MITQNEAEEIIGLINKGFSLKLLSFELDIPIEQIEEYQKQLTIRKYAKESIKNGTIKEAIKQLEEFIDSSENNIVEKLMLIKLKAYDDKINVSDEELENIDKERKLIGLSRNINEILEQLNVQIPKRKTSNIRKSNKDKLNKEENVNVVEPKEKQDKSDYNKTIENYKKDIAKNSRKKFK